MVPVTPSWHLVSTSPSARRALCATEMEMMPALRVGYTVAVRKCPRLLSSLDAELLGPLVPEIGLESGPPVPVLCMDLQAPGSHPDGWGRIKALRYCAVEMGICHETNHTSESRVTGQQGKPLHLPTGPGLGLTFQSPSPRAAFDAEWHRFFLSHFPLIHVNILMCSAAVEEFL